MKQYLKSLALFNSPRYKYHTLRVTKVSPLPLPLPRRTRAATLPTNPSRSRLPRHSCTTSRDNDGDGTGDGQSLLGLGLGLGLTLALALGRSIRSINCPACVLVPGPLHGSLYHSSSHHLTPLHSTPLVPDRTAHHAVQHNTTSIRIGILVRYRSLQYLTLPRTKYLYIPFFTQFETNVLGWNTHPGPFVFVSARIELHC